MEKTTYPGSETDNNEVYDNCDFQSTASNDFVDRWVNLTVDKEVFRGAQLREEKLKTYPQLLDCEVMNVDFNSPCPEDANQRKPIPGRSKGKTLPCSPRSKSPFFEQYHSSRCATQPMFSRSNTPSIKAKGVPRCSMRIAELAVPTKRQCFDTWRNKCDVLPPLMVERLRQQICDEKPIVPISEALVCFKRRRTRSVKSINRSFRSKTLSRDTKRKNEKNAEIRQLCAAFANKIARKLISPQNLNLNPELEKLSGVVANEITKIIQNRKKYSLDQNAHKRIHADISDKIAVWIATILEDSSYKLLEEDLRVKKRSERNIGDEAIKTIIGNFGQERTSELEEEEGPVLDFIDGLVDNVLTICEPEIINIDKEDVSEHTSKAGSERSIDSHESTGNNEFDTSTINTNITYDTGEGTLNKSDEMGARDSKTEISVIQEIDNQTFDNSDDSEGIKLIINNQVQEEIDKILNSIVGNDINSVDDMETQSKPAPNDNEQIGDESDLSREITLIQQSPGNSTLTPQINQVNSEPDLPLVEDDVSNYNLIDDMDDVTPKKIVEPEGDTMSAVSLQLAEESPDEKNKKVKFSNIDLAIRGSTGRINGTNSIKGDVKDKLPWSTSTDTIKHDLVLAPPNENLLSDADESWPEDIATPVIKPSASVSRSVTSLGKILEKDEKIFLQDDEILSIVNLDGKEKSELEATYKNVEQNHENKETDESKDLNEDLNKTRNNNAFMVESSPENQEMKTATNTQNEKTTVKAISSTRNVGHEIGEPNATNVVNTDKNRALQPKIAHNDMKSHDSEDNFLYEAIQQKMKTSYVFPEPKFNYKVHPNTAPSWLKNDNGKGEPSEDSFRGGCRAKAKFQDTEIRSWCKDLNRMFQNLEMWSAWVDTTCKNVLYLKQRKEMNKLFAPHAKRKDAKEWLALKKNIDKDSVLWTKLNQRAYARLKIYKDKAKYHLQRNADLQRKSGTDFDLILKTLEEVDTMCLRIHRMIVSTEHCTMCDYKNNPRRMM